MADTALRADLRELAEIMELLGTTGASETVGRVRYLAQLDAEQKTRENQAAALFYAPLEVVTERLRTLPNDGERIAVVSAMLDLMYAYNQLADKYVQARAALGEHK